MPHAQASGPVTLKIGAKANDQPWQELLRKSGGANLSTLKRLQDDVIGAERDLTKRWCEEVNSLVSNMVSQTVSNDNDEMGSIEDALVEIERKHEQQLLTVEAIASVFVINERKLMMSLTQERRMLLEYNTLSDIRKDRAMLHGHIFKYFDKQRRDSRLLCGRLPSLLKHTGDLLALSCERIFNQQRCTFLTKMASYRDIDMNAFTPGSIYTPIRNKTTLSVEDCHPLLTVANEGYTAMHMDAPSEYPRWAVIRSTNPVSQYPRLPDHHARRHLKMMLSSLRDITKVAGRDDIVKTIWSCLRAVHTEYVKSAEKAKKVKEAERRKAAAALDGTAPSTRAHSRATSVTSLDSAAAPHHARRLSRRISMVQDSCIDEHILIARENGPDAPLTNSIEELSLALHMTGYAGADLNEIDDDIVLRARGIELVQDMEQRAQVHGRFYFEAVAIGSHFDWMVGVTTETPLSRPEYLGADAFSMGVASDGRAYFNQQSMIYASGYRPGDIVGVVIDTFNGSLTLFKNGVEVAVLFGHGSRVFPAASVEQQYQLLSSSPVLPAIAIKGLTTAGIRQRTASTVQSSRPAAEMDHDAQASSEKRAPPQVSVNFGQLPFAFPVPETTPVERVRIMSNEADTLSVPGSGDEFVPIPVLQTSVRDVITQGDGALESGPDAIVFPTEDEFTDSIECEPPIAFSTFPPEETRMMQAAIIIQRGVRVFLMRVRQAVIQRDKQQMRSNTMQIVLFIQRRFRGNHTRRITNIGMCTAFLTAYVPDINERLRSAAQARPIPRVHHADDPPSTTDSAVHEDGNVPEETAGGYRTLELDGNRPQLHLRQAWRQPTGASQDPAPRGD